MIRAAIVGIGWWGRMLVNAVQGKSAAIRFTAGYTRTRATAEGFCADHSIALADDLDALLADPAVDAIVFATPHSQHGPQVERAAASGKPVFMEKPFTLDVASAERALRRGRGSCLSTGGFNRLHGRDARFCRCARCPRK